MKRAKVKRKSKLNKPGKRTQRKNGKQIKANRNNWKYDSEAITKKTYVTGKNKSQEITIKGKWVKK